MPRNNGVYTLPTVTQPPVAGTPILADGWANPTLADIAAALTGSIAADGSTQVTGNLPMNDRVHTGVGKAGAFDQYARADQVQAFEFNVVFNVACPDTVNYTGQVPFAIGGTKAIPSLMPIIFVPSVNNGGISTLALNGGAAIPILNSDLSQLTAGQIKLNRPYAMCYLGGNWILVTNTLDLVQLSNIFVPKAGGTMTGTLFLPADPAAGQNLAAATKHYVDVTVAGSVAGVASFAGPGQTPRTGIVTLLPIDITSALTYVPFNNAGGVISGNTSVNALFAANDITSNRFKTTAAVINPASGAVTVNPSGTSTNYCLVLSGPVTLTIVGGLQAGQVCRISFTGCTATNIVTWPPAVVWPGPTYAAPDLSVGPRKEAIVVIAVSATGAVFQANAVMY